MREAAGYSGTPLVKKLGIKEGFHVGLIGEPAYYKELLHEIPPKVALDKDLDSSDFDMVHIFVMNREACASAIIMAKSVIKRSGMIWVSWPKGTSGLPTELNENIIRQMALDMGLVDVKVCAVDTVWSGLKLVYRLKDR